MKAFSLSDFYVKQMIHITAHIKKRLCDTVSRFHQSIHKMPIF